MDIKNILKIVPTIQSVTLLNENTKLATKKKVNSKEIIKLGVANIVGVNLIKAESDFINSI